MAGQVPVHNAVHRIAQPTKVRFMELSSNGELYAVCGGRTVKRWYGEETVAQEILSTEEPIHALLVRHTVDYTDVFLDHDGGQIEMWRRNNLEANPPFRPQALLQTMRNNISNHLPAVVRNLTEINRITCLCLSEDREFIYGASTKGVIYAWWIGNDGKKKFVHRIDGYNGEVLSLAAGPNVVFSGSSDGHIRMYRREPRWLGTARHQVTHREIGMYPVLSTHPGVNALVFETHVDDATRGRLYAGLLDGRVVRNE